MYADDTVLFSETQQGLKDMINCLYQYTTKWNITVNVDKTKSVVFRKNSRIKENLCWKYDNEAIDIVDNFDYLGVTLNFNGNFDKTHSVLASQCKKRLSYLLVKMKTLCLNVSTKLKLFDTYISSTANDGCEIWGLYPAHEFERVHLDFCTQILSVKKSTVSMMLYSELGRIPLILNRKYRMIKYSLKLKKNQIIAF
jgi:hypothetical protein